MLTTLNPVNPYLLKLVTLSGQRALTQSNEGPAALNFHMPPRRLTTCAQIEVNPTRRPLTTSVHKSNHSLRPFVILSP